MIHPIVLLQVLGIVLLLAAVLRSFVRTAWRAMAVRRAARIDRSDIETGSAPPACTP